MSNNYQHQLINLSKLQRFSQNDNPFVELSGVNLTDGQKKSLLKELCIVDDIKSLKIENFPITNPELLELLKTVIIKNYHYLEKIELMGTHLGDQQFASMARILSKCYSLNELNLDLNDLTHNSVPRVAKIFRGNKNRFSLILSHNNLGFEAMEMFAEKFDVTNLQNFSLKGNKIGDEGAAKCLEKLKKAKHLKELDLSITGITSKFSKNLKKFLQECLSLTALNLRGNCLKNAFFIKISDAIKEHPALRFINIINTQFNNFGLTSFLETVNESLSVTEVKISSFVSTKKSGNQHVKLFQKFPLLNQIDNAINPDLKEIERLSHFCLRILTSKKFTPITTKDFVDVNKYGKQICQKLHSHFASSNDERLDSSIEIREKLFEKMTKGILVPPNQSYTNRLANRKDAALSK